ncbi:alpha-ketoglutarate-dependent dioxygenase alkB homolog 7, mitochondrial isoform X1 [Lingula anatina]|uniref:Alpha-ketoglutarate-dependent dioxygenase alkB homolog 7, mitochondrial isoform X1 n=1 Tax=Lingula anatina TaxID=7574 RepID=A0A1S3IJ02_LINAN|nr:alpha-ketoglutarate-dependent dioxygenase alkB homolog 7, mitochondrial isoform X1 [Lingula anatina]|eukprot:XP_013398088.1 alpha-ketoglutarate-dependent dioxygenase alkB homolog 7, mitochondrial isoform X1 [Lingula anatina]
MSLIAMSGIIRNVWKCSTVRIAICRYSSTARTETFAGYGEMKMKKAEVRDYIDASDPETESVIAEDVSIFENFLSEKEELSLLSEVEPRLKMMKYEFDHWDSVIYGYRETDKKDWNKANTEIINRVRELAFPPDVPQLTYVHLLDLSRSGYINPHIDSVRFCGPTIAGMNLLSSCVMKLVHEKEKDKWAKVLLKERSIYVLRGKARYDFTHEILPQKLSTFKGRNVHRERRIAIICRNEPIEGVEEKTPS